MQFYWFRAVRFHNALLCSNSSTLAKVLKADIAMSTINKKCWSAEFLDAFHHALHYITQVISNIA